MNDINCKRLSFVSAGRRRSSAIVVFASLLVGCGGDTAKPVRPAVPRNPNGTYTNPRTGKVHKLESGGGTNQGGSTWSWTPTDGSIYTIVRPIAGSPTNAYQEIE